MSTTPRLVASALSLVLWLLLCLHAWRAHRGKRNAARAAAEAPANPADHDAWWVVHASQTGMAEALAERTAQSLCAAGMPARVASIDQIDIARQHRAQRMLFVVSTYGEGDPPDAAADFADTAMTLAPDLTGLRYAVLALGDRSYDQFCGFGRRLDNWLRACAAETLFDRVDVDRSDPGALRHWSRQLALLGAKPDQPDWEMPAYQTWRLAQRVHLNPGSAGAACFHLSLVPADGSPLAWHAGDIAEIGPRAAPDGDLLAHREYSIASLPADGAVHLLVRQMRREDGSLGAGSGWLTDIAPLGSAIAMRLRGNRNFHPPEDDRPLLLVGNGTGIAGLRALIQARAARGHHRNWLVFGERNAAHDHFYGDDIARWREAGVLERVDAVFSRDEPRGRYVQHVLAESAEALRRWIEQGAAIYVCGSLNGMAGGVDDALRAILGTDTVNALTHSGRYRRDVY
jgi:sulfite reductase (NADPH) flavoprotein alpha-component